MIKRKSIAEKKHDRRERVSAVILIALLLTYIICLFSGCKSPQLPTLPTNVHSRDSIQKEYVHDSIYIDRWHKEYTKGDTVFIHDSIFRDRWKYKHDSIYISKIDTIHNQIIVEKKGSAFLRNSGIALWVLVGLILLAVIIGIILKFAK